MNAYDEPSTKPPWHFEVEVSGDLPYYIPMPERAELTGSLPGVEPFKLHFEHYQPPRHPQASHGKGVDDRLGTFIKSRVHVLFPVIEPPSEVKQHYFERMALNLTNKAIYAIKYVASDHTMRHVVDFDMCTTLVFQIDPDGTRTQVGKFSQSAGFGPFGLKLQATLTDDGLQSVQFVFNGLAPTNPARVLILDAKYHNTVGDISRAILDTGTALEVHIPSLAVAYSARSPELSRFDTDNLGIYSMYDQLLKEITGRSLHERTDLFVKLEYIRTVRNSVAHRWKPEFRITSWLEKSRYLAEHRQMDGHKITTSAEVDELIESATQIMKYAYEAFIEKYGLM